MTTIQEILTECRAEIGTDDTTTPNSKMLRALNDFGRDIQALNKNKTLTTDISVVAGTTQYTIPSGQWFPVAARYSDNNQYLPVPINHSSNVHEFDIVSGLTKGDPQFCYMANNKICIWPTPTRSFGLNIIWISRFSHITEAMLSNDFSTYFDLEYESYAMDYIKMNSLKKNDSLSKEIRAVFYGYQGAWSAIKRIESLKFDPFNGKTRRTAGAKAIGIPDYR